MSETPLPSDSLEQRLRDALHHERHFTLQETRYWCRQYKQLAIDAILGDKTCAYRGCINLWTVERRDRDFNIWRFCDEHEQIQAAEERHGR